MSGKVHGERMAMSVDSPMKNEAMVVEAAGDGGRDRGADDMPSPTGKRTARIRLTICADSAAALKPTSRSYIAWDDRLTGFGVRVLPTGTKSYILNYRPGGGRGAPNRRLVLGRCENTTADEARRMAEDALARIAAGTDPAAERAHARALRAVPTLGEALEAYLAAGHAPTARKAAVYRKAVHSHLGCWLERRLDTITHEDVERCFVRLTAEAGWMPANDAVRVLGTLYRHQCADIDVLHDPVEQWRSLGGRLHRQRRRHLPPPAEVLPCWHRGIEKAVRNPVARDAFRFGLYTGLGRDAVLGLGWAQVDMDTMTLTVEEAGSGMPMPVPLARQPGAILEGRADERALFSEHTRAHVFPSEAGPLGRLHRLQHLNGRIGEAGGARFWFDALHRNFVAVAEDELELPAGLAARLAGSTGLQYATGGGAAEWSMEVLRDDAQRIADRIDELSGFRRQPLCMRLPSEFAADRAEVDT